MDGCMMGDKKRVVQLKKLAALCRKNVLRMIRAGGHGHVGGAMSAKSYRSYKEIVENVNKIFNEYSIEWNYADSGYRKNKEKDSTAIVRPIVRHSTVVSRTCAAEPARLRMG